MDYKNKRTASLETYFNSKNINDISAQTSFIKKLNNNHKNNEHSSKSSLNINLKVSK
jgi:hypothetical protein